MEDNNYIQSIKTLKFLATPPTPVDFTYWWNFQNQKNYNITEELGLDHE